MNVMYNSDNYYVVEFPGRHGIELVDKSTGRAGFLEGAVEVKFRASMADLAAGEPLLRTDLVVRDGALADRVPAGKLALAIEADFVAGVAGRLAVGDVVVVTEAGAATSMALEVLALGVPTGEAGYRAVVVAVDGDQAARIAGLRGRGPIVLALRGTKTRAGEERP